jgi:hypothetical protein
MSESKRSRIVIPEDWIGRDRRLTALVQKTGFQSINQLAAHMLYEVSHVKTPRKFYRALSAFAEEARK